jgi:hypothetical protein
VDYLQPGEYTLAVWDELYVGTTEQSQSGGNGLLISPNPVRGICNIRIASARGSVLSIYSPGGHMLLSREFTAGRHQFDWQTIHLPSGIYITRLRTIAGELIESRKIIVP